MKLREEAYEKIWGEITSVALERNHSASLLLTSWLLSMEQICFTLKWNNFVSLLLVLNKIVSLSDLYYMCSTMVNGQDKDG